MLLALAIITLATAAVGIGIGLFAGSKAIVFNGMYALIDAGMPLAAWFAAGLIGRGEDRRFQSAIGISSPRSASSAGRSGFLHRSMAWSTQ
ncbi:hypothetical protein [Roseomonas sp. WA12]